MNDFDLTLTNALWWLGWGVFSWFVGYGFGVLSVLWTNTKRRPKK